MPLDSSLNGRIGRGGTHIATQFCQKRKQSHPGRTCDYDDQGESAETAEVQDSAEDNCVTRSSRTDEEPRGSNHQTIGYNGMIIDTQIRGLGTGTGLSGPVSFRADMGAMQGEYIGEDGKHHLGSFVFI